MTSEKKKQLFTPSKIFFYALTIIIFVVATRSLTKFRDIQTLLSEIKPEWLILALVAQVLTYVLHALIYLTLLRDSKGRLTLFEMIKIVIVILFVNQALPTGGISGNGYVFHSLTTRGIPKPRAFAILIYELVCFYATYILLLLAYFIWYQTTFPAHHTLVQYTLLGGILFYTILIGVMTVMSHKKLVSRIMLSLCRIPFARRFIKNTDNIFLSQDNENNAMHLFRQYPRASLTAMMLQMGIFIADIITIYSIVRGFHIPVSFAVTSFCLLLSLVIGALPLSPGSLIIYESAMTYFFTLMGVPVQAAIIITLLYRFFSFWLPLPIGLVLYRHLQRANTPAVTPV